MTLDRFAFYVVGSVIGWGIAFTIRAAYRSWASRKCRSGHRKHYLAVTEWTNINCEKHGFHSSDRAEWWSSWASWKCLTPGCNAVGEDCLGTIADWRVEHGEVVVDDKKTATRKDRLGPKAAVDARRAREQGLPKPINVQEALELLTELAVQVKKGRIGPIPDATKPVQASGEQVAGSAGTQ